VLFLCTGSQGEPNAALSKLARGDHPHVSLGEGDTVVFSSRVIPGNEKAIGAVQNQLADRGIELFTSRRELIHVSGHPCRDELRRMYAWARPRIAIPVHGERRHVLEHARLARSLQVPAALTPNNGDVVRLAPGAPAIIDEVPSGRLYLDGATLVPEGAAGLVERRKLATGGHVGVSVVIKGARPAVPAIVTARGFSEDDGSLADDSLEALDEAAESALDDLSKGDFEDDERIERALVRALRRAAEAAFGKRPLVDVVIHRI
jgi:ribonuclease J